MVHRNCLGHFLLCLLWASKHLYWQPKLIGNAEKMKNADDRNAEGKHNEQLKNKK